MIGRITIITSIMRYSYPENTGVFPFHLPTSCTPEVVSEVLMKVALVLQSQVLRISFFCLGFPSQTTFTNHWSAGEGGGYFFNLLLQLPSASQTLRHERVITAESSPLHIEVNRETSVSQRISVTTKLSAV